MQYLIAYDVCDPKRLRKVAERLERDAQRVQKSVFVFVGKADRLRAIQEDLLRLIDPHADRIQTWPILDTPTVRRWDAGTALPSHLACLIVSPTEVLLLEDAAARWEADHPDVLPNPLTAAD